MIPDLTPLQYNCSRPFYQLLAEAVNGQGALWNWPLCPYTITGLGLGGVGLIVAATGFVGLKNWSEGWTLPMTWLALVTPVLAAAMLPGTVLRRIAGIITLAFGVGIIVGLWYWWGRS